MDSAVQALFRELADLSPTERALYFERHPVDAKVRHEVESLLGFDGGESDDTLMGVIDGIQEQFAGSYREPFCGPYQLLRLLGQGLSLIHI